MPFTAVVVMDGVSIGVLNAGVGRGEGGRELTFRLVHAVAHRFDQARLCAGSGDLRLLASVRARTG